MAERFFTGNYGPENRISPGSLLFLSRKDYLFYRFDFPSITIQDMNAFIRLRLKNLYPGNLEDTRWFYFVQEKNIIVAVLTKQKYEQLKKSGQLEKALLPPSCQKKYSTGNDFDALVHYPDCYELFSVKDGCLADSHIFAVTGKADTEKRLCQAIDKFSGSEKLYIFDDSDMPGLKETINRNYGNSEHFSEDRFFHTGKSNLFRLTKKTMTSFPVPTGLRVMIYLFVSAVLLFLTAEEYLSAKNEIIYSQNKQIKELELQITKTESRIEQIEQYKSELDEISGREGIHVYSLMSNLAELMPDAIIQTLLVSGRDFEITGLHENSYKLVDDINKSGRIGELRLRSAVPDAESGRESFVISGSLP